MQDLIAKRLRDAMREEGFSATRMAAELDISTGRVSHLRYGEPMNQSQVITVCTVLNRSPTWLLMGIGPKYLSTLSSLGRNRAYFDQ